MCSFVADRVVGAQTFRRRQSTLVVPRCSHDAQY
jgi:hypothetical protein